MKNRTEQELKNIAFSWEMRDGSLVWKRPTKSRKQIGDPVGLTTTKSGHQNCYLSLSGKLVGYSVGQIAWFLYMGKWPDEEVDHKDCNPQNNLFENLRLSTRSEQCRNRISGKSGRPNKGVYKRNYGNKWSAQIWVDGVCKNLGTYDSEDEAVEIRQLATEMMHGTFANTKSYRTGVQA